MLRQLICLLGVSFACATSFAQADDARPLSLIPMPATLDQSRGHVTVDARTTIVVADKRSSTRRTAGWLSDLLARTRGLPLAVSHQRSGSAPAIVLAVDPGAALTAEESYVLDVTPQGIRVTARDDAGLFRGATTLWQLLTPDAGRGTVQVPAVHIRDQPRFSWRGLMLDSARHFQSVARGQAPARPDGAAQAQRLALASHRRPGLAHRNQEIPRTHSHRRLAHAARCRARRRAGAVRRLLYPAADPRRGGLCRRTLHHRGAGDRHARACAGSSGLVPATRRHRQTPAGVDRLGRQSRICTTWTMRPSPSSTTSSTR